MPTLAIIIILYKPTAENINHILMVQKLNHFIFIYDNSESVITYFETFKPFDNIRYFNDGKNEGIPIRLNQGCKLAMEENIDWGMFLDQDTIFTAHDFNEYIRRSVTLNTKEPNAFYTAFFMEAYIKNTNLEMNYTEMDCMITSTTLLPLHIYKKVGIFDEQLFLDFTDFDYSIRAYNVQIKQIFINNINVIHPIGKMVYRSSIKTLFLLKKKKSIHSPIRCYYIIRNYFYLKNKCKNNNIIYNKKILRSIVGTMFKNLLYGRDLFNYLFYMYKGFVDFKKNKFGKIK